MSEHEESFVPLQEHDRVARGSIVKIAILSVVIMAASLVAAWELLETGRRRDLAEHQPTRPAPTTIGTVEQTLVLEGRRGTKLRAEQRASLDRWGWVDRDAGVARIPIDRAMDLVAADAGAWETAR